MNEDPAAISNWQPKWEVDVGAGCKVGVTIDDHCFVVLVPAFEMTDGEVEYTGAWKPTSWIPMAAARLIAEKSMEREAGHEEVGHTDKCQGDTCSRECTCGMCPPMPTGADQCPIGTP